MSSYVANKISPIGKFLYEGRFVPIIGIGHRIEDFLEMKLYDKVNVMSDGANWYSVDKGHIFLDDEVLDRYRGEESRC